MKKRVLSIALVGVMALTMLAGCGSAKTEEAADKDLLATIQERGTMIVATEGCWAPYTYHNEADELVGFDVEVAKAVAAKLGVEAEFVEVDWDGIFAGIDGGRYDTTFNGVEITEERAEKYDFCEAYAFDRTALVVRTDNEDIKSFEDLAGKTTANSMNSTYMLLAESYGATCTAVDDLVETMEMLTSGRVDATLNGSVAVSDYMKEKPDAAIKVVAYTEDASRMAAPVRKEEATKTFKAAVDKAIKELAEDGTLSELSVKYFGIDITK